MTPYPRPIRCNSQSSRSSIEIPSNIQMKPHFFLSNKKEKWDSLFRQIEYFSGGGLIAQAPSTKRIIQMAFFLIFYETPAANTLSARHQFSIRFVLGRGRVGGRERGEDSKALDCRWIILERCVTPVPLIRMASHQSPQLNSASLIESSKLAFRVANGSAQQSKARTAHSNIGFELFTHINHSTFIYLLFETGRCLCLDERDILRCSEGSSSLLNNKTTRFR